MSEASPTPCYNYHHIILIVLSCKNLHIPHLMYTNLVTSHYASSPKPIHTLQIPKGLRFNIQPFSSFVFYTPFTDHFHSQDSKDQRIDKVLLFKL